MTPYRGYESGTARTLFYPQAVTHSGRPVKGILKPAQLEPADYEVNSSGDVRRRTDHQNTWQIPSVDPNLIIDTERPDETSYQLVEHIDSSQSHVHGLSQQYAVTPSEVMRHRHEALQPSPACSPDVPYYRYPGYDEYGNGLHLANNNHIILMTVPGGPRIDSDYSQAYPSEQRARIAAHLNVKGDPMTHQSSIYSTITRPAPVLQNEMPQSLSHKQYEPTLTTWTNTHTEAVTPDVEPTHDVHQGTPHSRHGRPRVIPQYDKYNAGRVTSSKRSKPAPQLNPELAWARADPTQDELDLQAPPIKRKRVKPQPPSPDGLSLDDIVKAKVASAGPPPHVASIMDHQRSARDFFRLQNIDIQEDSVPSVKAAPESAPVALTLGPAKQTTKKPDWRKNTAFKNPPWYEQGIRAAVLSISIPVLVTMDLVKKRQITKALKSHFKLIERVSPQQSVELILSASTGVIFLGLDEVESKRDHIIKRLTESTRHYQQTIVVMLWTTPKASVGTEDDDIGPADKSISAISALKRYIGGAVLSDVEDPSTNVHWVFALNGVEEAVKALRYKLEEDFVTLRGQVGDVAAAAVCEKRQWLYKDEVSSRDGNLE